ncbi:MAG: hypothetical protein KAU20_00220, partial [Nanoarchaeota archaeon]|nr:hypothetical protein [Nanoarchaeota archaeon]
MDYIIDDATLSKNGYTWDEDGGYLVDTGGNYLESVTIGDKTMRSVAGIDEYNKATEEHVILEQEGFQYDENSSSSRYAQRRTALAEYEFKKYQDAPIETTISRNSLEDGSFQEAFEKDRQKKIENGEPAYPDVNTMVQGEEGDIFSDLDPEDVPLYKNLIAERKKILTEDPDFDTKAQAYIDETDKELEENSWYNPMNIGLHVSNIIDEVAMTIADTGSGMESEEKKARLLEVEAEISRLHIPFIDKTIEKNNVLLKELERIGEEEDFSARASLEYSYASDILEAENAKLKESKEGAWFPAEMFNGWNLVNQVLRGLPEVTTQMPLELALKLSINEHGEKELTPSQKFLAEAFATKTKIEEAQIKQTYLHDFLVGFNHSLEFMSLSKLGRGVGKKIAGKVVSKGLTGKVARTLVNVGTQAALHGSTYTSATSTYSGPIREVEKEDGSIGFTTDRHTYDSLQEEMDYSLSMIEEQLYQERENKERVEELLLTKEKLEEVKKELKTSEPAGALGSLGHGFIESAKEAFAETYFGPLMGKIFGKTMKSRAGRYLTNSKTGKWLNSSDSALKDIFNRKYGEGVMPGQRLIGSNLEEWGEEVFVQIVPTMSTNPQYNQDGSQKTFFEEYKSQLGELLTWDFHTKVVAQTLLMSKGAQSLGWASQNMSKYGGSIPLFNSKETRAKSKQVRQTSRDLSKTIKSLGDLNQSSKSFELNLMGTGEGSFNMSDYNTRIALLKKEGLFVEAGQLERDKIYKQAVAAVNSGKGREFLKSMVKAQYNKNLSPETKSVIKRLETEVNNMLNDNSTYLNSSTITSLKAKNRFAKQTIADIEKAQMESGADMIEINREFEKVGLSFSDIANPNLTETDYENVQEKLTTLKKRLSPEAERHVLLEMLKVESKETVAGFNSAIKDATSNETQVFLAKQKAYSRRVDLINKYRYSSKMTAKEFKDVVAPALFLNSKTDGLSKEAVYDMNDRVHKLMLEDERQALASYRALMDAKKEIVTTPPEAVVTEPNYVENIKETVEVASAGMQAQAKEAIESTKENDDSYLSDPDSDAVIQNHDSLDLMLPMDKVDDTTVITLQKWAKEYEKEMDTPPTFEDYWGLIVKTYGDKHVFDKESLEWIAGQWEFAELESPSWKKIWAENYLDLGNSALASFQGAVTRNDTEEEVTREATESKIESKVKTEPSAGISSSTGSPISLSMGEKTMNTGKTTVTSPKGNFSGIKYLNVETTEGDTVYHKKEDIDSEIPVLNEESHLDIKELLYKNKNQPGDILDIRVSDERDWDNPKILVSVGDPVSGKATKYITFADWIIANHPKEMSLEEFKKTEKFISKVPMFYVGSNGKDVMHIPDTDWYNALNLLDKTTQEGGDDVVGEVDIDNPSPQLLSDINQGKENTLKLRQQILNGDVTKGEIESKDGSIWVNIPKEDAQGNKIPPKKLGEVAKDNPIVLFNGVNFVDLDNKVVAGEVVISNKKYAEDYYKKAKGSSYQTYYLSPTHKKDNKQYYVAIGVLRKNENEENQAHSEDVQSAKWILAAQNVLASGKPKYKMTIEQAQGIRKQIIKETGVDIRPLNNARDLVNSMIAIQDPTSKRVYSAYDMDVPSPKKERDSKGVVTTTTKLGPFMDGLFFGSYTPIQNTGLKKKKSHGLSVVKKEGKFQISRIGENYTEYLQERLSTNFMSYNMGTEKDPAFTISVQPIIKMNPILKEGKVESTQEKENIQPEVKIEVTETKEESDKLTTEELAVLKESEDILKEYNSLNEIESEEDQMLPVMGDVNIIQESLKTIGGLSSKSQREVISNLISTIISNFDPTVTSSIGEHYDKVENSFKEVYQSKLGKLNTVIDKIEELAEKFPEDKGIRHRLSNLRATKSNVSVVTENYKDFFVSAFAEAQKRGLVVSNSDTSLKEELAQELDDHITGEMYAKDLYKNANETVHKDKIGIKLKRIFSGIYTGDTGFLGTPLPANPDTIYNYVATLLSSPLPTDPSFEAMVERLEIIKDSVPWISPLIKKLREADQN